MCRILVERAVILRVFLLEKESGYLEKIEIDIAKGGKKDYSIYKEFRKYSK